MTKSELVLAWAALNGAKVIDLPLREEVTDKQGSKPMTFQYTIDLSRYTDNEVALMLVQGVISRREFEEWRVTKNPVRMEYGLSGAAVVDQETTKFV